MSIYKEHCLYEILHGNMALETPVSASGSQNTMPEEMRRFFQTIQRSIIVNPLNKKWYGLIWLVKAVMQNFVSVIIFLLLILPESGSCSIMIVELYEVLKREGLRS